MNTSPIQLHCKKCNCETTHYLVHGKYRQCSVCMANGRKLAAEKKREELFNKRSRDLANNIVQRREYNLMTAPIYTGEKWANVRGQMR